MRTTSAEVQAWVSSNRITVTDDDLVEQIEDMVLARLETAFDTSGWTTSSNTPDLVRQVIALLNAGLILRRYYSDQDDGVPYADKLEAMAEAMLMKIESGQLTLTIGTVAVSQTTMDAASDAAGPVFFPTEAERLDDSDDAQHTIKFAMGEVF